jgi:hypothetical protein
MTYFGELHVKVHYMKLQHGNAVEITSSFIVEKRLRNGNVCWAYCKPYWHLELGLGYEMPCGPVDGMNPVKVAEAMKQLTELVVEMDQLS